MDNILNILVVVGIPILLSWPLGTYLTAVMQPAGRLSRPHAFIEALFARLGGRENQDGKRYLIAMLVFNASMFAVSTLVMATQPWHPLNPDGKGALTWDLIFNTASSFVTNTNLQHYSGEASMSYFTQLAGLMWLQFVSAATGIACLAAMARGLSCETRFGNFFLDLQRATFLVLLPLATVVAILYALGGMPMTLLGAADATTLDGAVQTIARGPVAAFVAIKQLGTNGGGFFGPNSTHPFENPTFFTNLISIIAILQLPMSCVWMFGRITRQMRDALVVFAVMLAILLVSAGWALWTESEPTSAFTHLAVESGTGNLEGKELRLGTATGPLWSVITTSTSNGAVGSMHNSLNPLTGLAPLTGMWLNETFGGVGVGMINMFIYLLVAVFLAGMMVGRTPVYMGKRIESREMILTAVVLLMHPLLILGGAALFAATPWGAGTIANAGPRGFTEILYEFTSAAANNGSGYEGLSDSNVPWNVATGIVMLVARFVPILLPIAIAGSLAAKRSIAETAGTLRTDSPTFGFMLFGVIVLFGALTFLPVAVLGPIAEHLIVHAGA